MILSDIEVAPSRQLLSAKEAQSQQDCRTAGQQDSPQLQNYGTCPAPHLLHCLDGVLETGVISKDSSWARELT